MDSGGEAPLLVMNSAGSGGQYTGRVLLTTASGVRISSDQGQSQASEVMWYTYRPSQSCLHSSRYS